MTTTQPAAVELIDVERTYPGPPPVRALKQIDLRIPRGEYLAIIGPSGSGKSTLLNLLGLLDRPSAGTYRLAGVDVSGLAERDRAACRAQLIGFVFQSFHLLDQRSSLENVMLGALYQHRTEPTAELAARAARTLTSVGLAHRLEAPPSRLSGGERQRVAIARALINHPELLLCDEPTGNLDSGNTATVLGLLDNVHATGQTVVVITHDPEVAAHAQRRVAITDGNLTEVD
ncbi:MAG: putative transporter ATP-binding protein [Marmoricola sp.]|nr:putative transporter ATP-binding protein [Marmoricola sp.]